jgi:transcriptional regulator with XRE-family HTH domain
MTGLIPRPHRPRLATAQRRFGEYVRERRQAKRIGLRALAEQVGLAAGHLSNIEHARCTPPEEPTILRMAEVLDIPIGALLARAGKLGPADLHRFWESPLIPSLVMSSTGWNQEEVAIFVETVLASLHPMDNKHGQDVLYLSGELSRLT